MKEAAGSSRMEDSVATGAAVQPSFVLVLDDTGVHAYDTTRHAWLAAIPVHC